MTEKRYEPPASNPQSRLRELQQDISISPEIAELRLAILRRDTPDAIVQIDTVRADDTSIAVKATIGLPGGARHSVIAAADVDTNSTWADQLEMVQAIAIAKALDGLGIRATQEPAQPPSRQQSARPTAPEPTDHLPEYSWNAFWQTMNSRNITRDQVQQALGKSVQEATPKEAMDALKSAGMLG